MYIGSTDVRGLHHLVWEVVDNSIDEAMAGHATHVEVRVLDDGSVRVTDDGRGVPVGRHPTGKDALEVVHTVLHAGGKFGGGGYKVSGGLHGVGVSVVNALSEWLRVESARDGHVWAQEYARGSAHDGRSQDRPPGRPQGHDNCLQGRPRGIRDGRVLLRHDRPAPARVRLPQQGPLDPSRWTSGRTVNVRSISRAGLVSFVRHLNKNKEASTTGRSTSSDARPPPRSRSRSSTTTPTRRTSSAFANNINTVDGGTHLTGFRAALTRSLNDYARRAGILKDADANLSGDDVREGLTAVVSVKLVDPQFEGQTKAKLGNAEVKGQVEAAVAEGIGQYLDENPADGRRIDREVA